MLRKKYSDSFVSHPCDKTMAHIFWKLLIVFQLFKKNAAKTTNYGKTQLVFYTFWKNMNVRVVGVSGFHAVDRVVVPSERPIFGHFENISIGQWTTLMKMIILFFWKDEILNCIY